MKVAALFSLRLGCGGHVTLACGTENASSQVAPKSTADSSNDSAGADSGEESTVAGSTSATASSSADMTMLGSDHQGNDAGTSDNTTPHVDAGQGGNTGDSASDEGTAASTSADTTSNAPDISFADGSKLVIPRGTLPERLVFRPLTTFRGNEYAELDILEKHTSIQIADGFDYPRQLGVVFDMQSLLLSDCEIFNGMYEVESVSVQQDIDGTGAHLMLEQGDSGYVLTHDGPGSHRVDIMGKFVTEISAGSSTTNCLAIEPGLTEIAFSYTMDVFVTHMESLVAEAPQACGEAPVVLSGHDYPAYGISVLDAEGNPINAQNIATPPLEIVIETEKQAEFGPADDFRSRGVVVTGEQQMVRVSTERGTLYTYQLLPMSAVDAWRVQYWYAETYLSTPVDVALDDEGPAMCLGRRIGAVTTLLVAGQVPCSPLLATDFGFELLTPDVCGLPLQRSALEAGPPGDLVEFTVDDGTCEFELSLPEANGETGLVSRFTGVFIEP